MKTLLSLFFIFFLIVITGAAQDKFYSGNESGYISSLRANLRGTPSSDGKVVDVLDKYEKLSLIKQEGTWFLVQSANYVGWLHGSVFTLDSAMNSSSTPDVIVLRKTIQSKPQTTTKEESNSNSPFSAEYVGSDVDPTITITNNSNKNMTLLFGGVKYKIVAGGKNEITVDGGNYEYNASAPGVRPAIGVKTFSRGYAYSWTFYIKTVYR